MKCLDGRGASLAKIHGHSYSSQKELDHETRSCAWGVEYGTKDFWALMAHYFIPDSGHSGRRGFGTGMVAIDVAANGLGQSDFFRPDHLSRLFNEYWDRS